MNAADLIPTTGVAAAPGRAAHELQPAGRLRRKAAVFFAGPLRARTVLLA